jgi:hypothetical protein
MLAPRWLPLLTMLVCANTDTNTNSNARTDPDEDTHARTHTRSAFSLFLFSPRPTAGRSTSARVAGFVSPPANLQRGSGGRRLPGGSHK